MNAGIDPVMELLLKMKFCSSVSLDNDDGIEPDIWLWDSDIVTSDCKEPN